MTTQQQTLPALRFPEFSGEWIEKELGSIAELTSSKRVYLSDYVDNGIPFYRGKEISELRLGIKPSDILYITKERYEDFKEKYGIPQIGDILITAVGTLGNVLRIGDDSEFYFKDGNLIWLRKINNDSGYLEILLQWHTRELIKTSIGSTQKALTMVELRKICFLFPSNKEQQKIAAFLSSVDTKIEQLGKKKALLEQYKKGMMQKLFSGILRFPEYRGKPRKARAGYTISKLGALPIDWDVEHAENHLWFQEGPGVRKIQFTKSGVKLFNGTNIQGNTINLSNTSTYISQEEANSTYSHFLADEGDLVIACSGISVDKFDEKIGFLSTEDLPLCMNTSTMRFKSKGSRISIVYFSYFMRTPFFKNQIRRQITGSAQLNFGPSHVATFLLALPSIEEQQKIANFLSAIDQKIELVGTELEKAQTFKKGLLQQLFI